MNVHFHALLLDGVFHEAGGASEASPAFRATGRLGPTDLADVLQVVHAKILRLLRRREEDADAELAGVQREAVEDYAGPW